MGVDGGNSKTLAVIATGDGRILGWGRGGGSNIYLGENSAVRELTRATNGALAAAGVASAQIALAVYCLSGADWANDFAFWQETLTRQAAAQRILIINDALGALRVGSPDGTGVAVVCGTGTGTAARNVRGESWYSGAWQRVQGAFDLGQRALRAIVEAELGIAPPTSLTQNALELFGKTSVEGLLESLTQRRRSGVLFVTRLTLCLTQQAEKGDPVAHSILRQHGLDLGGYAVYAARRMGFASTEFNLVTAGSVLAHSAVLREALVERVRQDYRCTHYPSRAEPVIGALLLALDTDDTFDNVTRLENIAETMPPIAVLKR